MAATRELAGRLSVNLVQPHLAAVIGPTDRHELGMRFLIRHTRDGAQQQRAWGRGKKEVRSIALVVNRKIINYDV